jgi:hypothetical protein
MYKKMFIMIIFNSSINDFYFLLKL